MRQILSLLLPLATAFCLTTPATAQPTTPSHQPIVATTRSKTAAISKLTSSPSSAISKLMADQAAAWNRGSLDDFMKGYWNNDSLAFIGKEGPVYGYQQALSNYKKHYDSPDKMGQLTFTLIKIDQLSPDYCFVIGKWALKRNAGDIGGTYTLLFRKIKGSWVIIVDHTS
jgi:ketosteroid isomerase-like protein